MPYIKEKRHFERFQVSNVLGAVELKGLKKEVSIINACRGGVCISGAEIPIGTIVRLHIAHPENADPISLYCKVVWEDNSASGDVLSGLALLNTNRILFESELESFGRLLTSIGVTR
jgi:hypothetical protein